MQSRTAIDLLREEYSVLVPHARRAVEELEAEVRYLLIPVVSDLASYERVVIKSRVKECESAVAALIRRQEGERFDGEALRAYSLRSLRDLAGVRVLAFPRHRVTQIQEILQSRFPSWQADPVAAPDAAEPMAFKCYGRCSHNSGVCAELQVVGMLIGLFWEVEHGALYKPAAAVREPDFAEEMRQRNGEVVAALRAFDRQFDALLRKRSRNAVPN